MSFCFAILKYKTRRIMFRSRSWFGGGWGRPKNPHSLDHLKYLHNIMSRNQTVSESNRSLLVETLRSIAEILIWGDQNDSSVFDFFLEKNMLSFFLRIMKQRSGGSNYVCVQLLQTLNILFENIRNETSLYYLLSNNHVNSIIVHKFDFSDEEVMAYYISFLKTLSLKLNSHTIHFFYNEHTNDFPLYTEAIKFFNHSESMVRIAVRTLTLNVYRVDDTNMLKFIRDHTAAPYFSNLVWFIGKHVLELDNCIRNEADHQSQNRLADLVAEHLDHLHYVNDILCLNIANLNEVLTEHLLHKLLIPLYIYSLISHDLLATSSPQKFNRVDDLTRKRASDDKYSPLHQSGNNTAAYPRISCVVALFLLSQVFLIITHPPLVHSLAWVILNGDISVFKHGAAKILENYKPDNDKCDDKTSNDAGNQTEETQASDPVEETTASDQNQASNSCETSPVESKTDANITDEEKQRLQITHTSETEEAGTAAMTMAKTDVDVKTKLVNKPFLERVLSSMDVSENDYSALFSLCLLFALANNRGISVELLSPVFGSRGGGNNLADRLLRIITVACQQSSRVRLVTLALALRLLSRVSSLLTPQQRQTLATAREQSTIQLRNYYKSEEIFLDMFEHEYYDMSKRPLNVEWLCMDSAILLPPTGTPMTGIEFTKRLPCGEVERARRAIRVYFLARELTMQLNGDVETQLPLANLQKCVSVGDVLDLSNIDLIACTVVHKDNVKLKRFLAIDDLQIYLVEPEMKYKQMGYGVIKFVGLLQDVEQVGDKDDSRCLYITIQRSMTSSASSRVPLLSARFIFDDHIRCMAAKQRLSKGRVKARQKKLQQIARLLDIPGPSLTSNIANSHIMTVGLQGSHSAGLAAGLNILNSGALMVRPGHATPRDQSVPGTSGVGDKTERPRPSAISGTHLHRSRNDSISGSSSRGSSNGRSRDNSPRMPRPRSEEIPLEMIKKANLLPSNASTIVEKSEIEPLTEHVVDESTTCNAKHRLASDESIETSFIAATEQSENILGETSNDTVKRKGAVEIV